MLLALILLLFSFAPAAQPVETWYFGLVDSDLIAFTPAGERQTIAPDFGEIQIGWRFDAQTALFISKDRNGTDRLYRAAPEGVTEIPVPGDPDLSNLRLLPAYAGDYVMLSVFTPGYFPAMGVLVNVPAASAEVLTGRVGRIARFDGELLRYASVSDDNRWTLLERSLTSGEERAIHSFTAENNTPPFFSADSLGSRWIYIMRVERQLVSTLVSADGTTEVLDSGTQELPLGWVLVGDTLMGYSPACQSHCPVTFQQAGETAEMMLQDGTVALTVLGRPSIDTLVVSTNGGDQLLLLEPDAAPRLLGQFVAVSMLISPEAIVSPDDQYLFSAVEDAGITQFFVTALASLTPVYAAEDAVAVQVQWFRRGFVASTYGRDVTASAYLYDSQQSLELPNRDAGTYFDILPDDTLLYGLNEGNAAVGAAGIYRYDPAQGSFTLLVEGARVAYTLPLE